jgi:hypothetical protein
VEDLEREKQGAEKITLEDLPSTRGLTTTHAPPSTSERERNTATNTIIAKKKVGSAKRRAKATSSSSKVDDVLLISTTNETRARLQTLLSDIGDDIFLIEREGEEEGTNNKNNNYGKREGDDEPQPSFLEVVYSIGEHFLQFPNHAMPKWSVFAAHAIKILLKRTDLATELRKEENRKNRRALLTLLLCFTRITSLHKKIKDEVESATHMNSSSSNAEVFPRTSSTTSSSSFGAIRKKDIVAADDPSTQKLTMECFKTCENCKTMYEGVKMIQSCVALAIILTLPQLNTNNNNSNSSNNSESNFSSAAENRNAQKRLHSPGSAAQQGRKNSFTSSRESSASPSLEISASNNNHIFSSGYNRGSSPNRMSPMDSPTSHSRTLLGSSPLGQSYGTRISNEFSRFSNVSTIAQTLAANDVEREDAFDNSKYSSQSPTRRTKNEAAFVQDGVGSPTGAGPGSRGGRGVLGTPSRVVCGAERERADDENVDR